jgi:hypothetical protein
MATIFKRGREHARARRRAAAMLFVAITLFWSATASAQLDPLLFVKRVPPTVIIVVDTSMRMLEDGLGNYYDPNDYLVSNDPTVASALNVATATRYRRTYVNLQFENVQDPNTKFVVTNIRATADTAATYSTFYNSTRLEMVKAGIDKAVSENAGTAYRWGLIRLRQQSPTWRVSPNCDKPVRVTGNAALMTINDSSPCNTGSSNRFGIYVPTVSTPNYSIETTFGGGARVVAPASNTAASVLTVVRRPIGDSSGLVPAGGGALGYDDRPIAHALDDARAAAVAAINADSAAMKSCRNTIVVLITSGKDDGEPTYAAAHDPTAVASTFASVPALGVTKRIPIHVIAVRPPATDEAELQTIAANSGGRYTKVTSAAQIAQNINYAVQAGFARSTDFDAGSTSEYAPVSPIVGTVNLKGAVDATGTPLANTDINATPGGQPLAQRSNVMITAGFTLPGFEGVLRAFRVYRPETDSTKPTGWKFVNDGSRLWPDLDGRPQLAGRARAPKDPNTRNIYTYIPNGSGGGSVVAFTTANESILRSHMNMATSASSLITLVRAQELGAIIGSTPALMDVPSLDPPPDSDYGFADSVGTFAGTYKDRRAMIFYGGNDGMIHAIDARTGYEVWAFIPYNLLPKLKTLEDGQPIEQFDFFVDSSPKIAEVKTDPTNPDPSKRWHSLLLIGEGPGGTFYQAFDVTEAGMNVAPELDGSSTVTALLSQFDLPDESIKFKWAFPNYSSFDPAYSATFTVTDATSGGKVKIFGDLKSTATKAEKTVGFSWSDPAVGPLDAARTTNAVIVGSGYFPDIETLLPGRGASAPKAGNALYLINANTGQLIGNASGDCSAISSGSGSGPGCVSIGDVNGNSRKNALQADPTAAGVASSLVVQKAYLGDLDGKYWRFDFNSSGTISASQMIDTGQPVYASSALLFIGTAEVYMFFATGSDLLPTIASGGTGTFKLYGLKDDAPANGATTKFAINLAATTNVSGLATGERPSTSPSVAGDIVFYTTTTETASTPCADFTGKLYALTYVGSAAYDANANGKIDSNESPIAATMAGRATAPFIVDQHLYVGAGGSTGANVEAFGDPEDFNNGVGQVGVRILSWREIR